MNVIGQTDTELPQGNGGQLCADNVTDCMSKGELPPEKSENPQCPDNGNVTDCQTSNLAPIASAGSMQEVSSNESVSLNGLGSYDPDGNISSFHWAQTAGQQSVKLQDSDTTQPSFIAPVVLNESLLTFELTVIDNMGLTDTDSAVVSVSNTDSSKGNQFTAKTENGTTDTHIKTKLDTQVNKTTGADKAESITSFQPYRYNELGVSVEHPPEWKFASLKNGIQLIKEKNGVYVEIRKHNLESSNTKLKQYVFDDIKDRSNSRQDFEVLNITATTISGNLPGYKTEYTFLKTADQKDFNSKGTTNKILRYWTFANGNAYTVAYVSERGDYDLYLPIALKIIDTLKINPASQQSFSDNDSNDDKKKSNDSKDAKKKSNDSKDAKKKSNDSNDDNNDSKGNDSDYKDKDGDGDIDCKDVGKNVKVGSDDPYDLDRDGDGIGCDG